MGADERLRERLRKITSRSKSALYDRLPTHYDKNNALVFNSSTPKLLFRMHGLTHGQPLEAVLHSFNQRCLPLQ